MSKRRSKLVLRILLFAGTIISLFFVPWILVKAWILPLPDTVQEQLNEAVDHGFDGVIVYIDEAGQPPRQFAAGWHDRDLKVPARPDALFKIASIGKLYDAMALTKMIGDGRLSSDNTLADYLPELVGRIEYASNITLRMMLQHRSGIPNYTDSPNFWEAPDKTYEENLGLILDKPADFEPDTDYAYSNTNYLLLSRIMGDELGHSHHQLIREEILKPLNLTHTFGSLSEVDLDEVMSGYHVGYPHDLKEGDLGMLATAQDVGVFLRALNDGSLFDNGEKEIYSYEYEHGGWVPGYQSFANYYEEQDVVLVAFYSTTDARLLNWNLSEIINSRILEIMDAEDPLIRPKQAIPNN